MFPVYSFYLIVTRQEKNLWKSELFLIRRITLETVKTFATFSSSYGFASFLNSFKNTETKIRSASLCSVFMGSCCLPTPPSVETVFRCWHGPETYKNPTCHSPGESKNLLSTGLSLFNVFCLYSPSILDKSQPYGIQKLASEGGMHKQYQQRNREYVTLLSLKDYFPTWQQNCNHYQSNSHPKNPSNGGCQEKMRSLYGLSVYIST